MIGDEHLARLAEPFRADEVRWRISRTGEKDGRLWARCVAYITASMVTDRLDAVLGSGNWQVDGLSDAEAGKGDFSIALRRAAVHWGIGKYLGRLREQPATISDGGRFKANRKNQPPFRWDPPALPDFALPEGSGGSSAGEPIRCPNCGGAPQDFRAEKAAGRKKRKFPDLKCACGWVVWLEAWRDELLKRIADVGEPEHEAAREEAVRSLDPALMARVHVKLDTLEAA